MKRIVIGIIMKFFMLKEWNTRLKAKRNLTPRDFTENLSKNLPNIRYQTDGVK